MATWREPAPARRSYVPFKRPEEKPGGSGGWIGGPPIADRYKSGVVYNPYILINGQKIDVYIYIIYINIYNTYGFTFTGVNFRGNFTPNYL